MWEALRAPHERLELGAKGGPPELFVELGLASGEPVDRAGGAADVHGGPLDAAAGGDEGADFAAFGFVQDMRAAAFGA